MKTLALLTRRGKLLLGLGNGLRHGLLVVGHTVVGVGLEHHLSHVGDGRHLSRGPLDVVLVEGHALQEVEHRLVLAGALIHKYFVYNEFLNPNNVVDFVREVGYHVEEVGDLLVLRHVGGDRGASAAVRSEFHVVWLKELARVLLLLVVKFFALPLEVVRVLGVFNVAIVTVFLRLGHWHAGLRLIDRWQVHREEGRDHELVSIGFLDQLVVQMRQLTDLEL